MVTIEYFGINPNATELLGNKEFRRVIEANPELYLVTIEEEDEYVNRQFYLVELPLPKGHDENVAVIDADNRESFMWILNEDLCSVTDPSPAFIELLKAMDDYSIENLEARLFLSQDDDLSEDSPEILAAEYDFIKGEYIL
jgi:hypothetical protein